MEGTPFDLDDFRASRLLDLACLQLIKRQFIQKVINGEVEITAADIVRVCQEEKIVRQELGQNMDGKPVDKADLAKAFLAAIEAVEAPPDGG